MYTTRQKVPANTNKTPDTKTVAKPSMQISTQIAPTASQNDLQIIQTKLIIGSPNDIYEKEADRVAENIMRMPDPVIIQNTDKIEPIPTLSIQRMRKGCDENLQCRAETNADGAGYDLTPVESALRSPGRLLDTSVREFYEPRFGVDFSAVRIYNDSNAHNAARIINAQLTRP